MTIPVDRIAPLRRLIRSARVATLATVTCGEPRAALVTPACTPDLSLILLLSELSQHTIHLRREPVCALLCVDEAASAGENPQQLARASLVCDARPVDQAALRARYLSVHPYAGSYISFADFHLWQLSIRSAHYIAGFAQAWSADAEQLFPDQIIADAVAAEESRLLEHYNRGQHDAVRRIGRAATGHDGAWQLTQIDVDGCELASNGQSCRVDWRSPVATVEDVRVALAALARSEHS